MEGENTVPHLHITAWAVAIILLVVVSIFYKQGKNKPGKILHMILRLFYLVIIGSGVKMLIDFKYPGAALTGELIIKVIAGLWTIVSIELITVRTAKGKSTKAWWIQFVIAAIIAIGLGFARLPYGILP